MVNTDSCLADAKPLCRAICRVIRQIVFCLIRSIHKLLASGRQPQKRRSVVRESHQIIRIAEGSYLGLRRQTDVDIAIAPLGRKHYQFALLQSRE